MKNKIENIIPRKLANAIFTIFHPKYWVMGLEYDDGWDKKLRHLMETENFAVQSRFEATIGGATFWIKNHPCATFNLIVGGAMLDVRPSRLTIHEAREKFFKDIIK